jgi:subtilisin family serine protease
LRIGISANETKFEVKDATSRPPVSVRIDKLIYADGDPIQITLDAGRHDLGPRIVVVLAAPETKDLEIVQLVKSKSSGVFVNAHPVRVKLSEGPAQASETASDPTKMSSEMEDGIIHLRPNGLLVAMYYVDHRIPSLRDAEADIVADAGLGIDRRAAEDAPVKVEPLLAMTEDELKVPSGGKPIGTLAQEGGLPIQIPLDELVLFPRDQRQLNEFLSETCGVVRRTDVVREEEHREPAAYLVQAGCRRVDVEDVPQLRSRFGETGMLLGSSEDVLCTYGMALYYQMRGYVTGVNPRLQFQAAPIVTEEPHLSRNMKDVPPYLNVPRLWAYLSLWDVDRARINLAILDMGFAPNPDFRIPAEGMVECDLEGSSIVDGLLQGFRCGPGRAVGPPTVGDSFFGHREWHGTGVVITAGGVVNNDWGTCGVGGQVVVPMLYRFGVASYAFEIGLGIRKAVLDGASVINISAGYPCRIIDNAGIDFEICSAPGRLLFCTAVTAALAAAAALVCAAMLAIAVVLEAIPFVGTALAVPFIAVCAAAVAAVVAASTICLATLVAGDVEGVMERAVSFATAHGVPVVTIAGNNINGDNLPPIIRDFINTEERRTDRWGIIPAMIPDTIVAGAADPDTLRNVHFFGNRVDVWAPICANYQHPNDVDNLYSPLEFSELGGTSAAAPFISGVIAAMQAINPRLDPRSGLRSGTDLALIPGEIKVILSQTAFPSSILPVDPTGERRNLINPLGAVKRAARGHFPIDFDSLGYDAQLNFDETAAPSPGDTPASATMLSPGVEITGTIVSIRGERGVTAPRDVDFFRFRTPANPGLYRLEIWLRTPAEDPYGHLLVRGESIVRTPLPQPSAFEDEWSLRTPLLFPDTEIVFSIEGLGNEDNVYKLRTLPLTRERELPTADRFDRDDATVNPPESRPNNNVESRAVNLGLPGEFEWARSPGILAETYEIHVTDLNFHERGDVDYFVIRDVPDFPMHPDVPGCQPQLEIRFSNRVRLTVNSAGRTLVLARPSPVRIPSSMFAVPLYLRFEPAVDGEFVEYEFDLVYTTPSEDICRYAEIFGNDGGVGGGGPGPFPSPGWMEGLKSGEKIRVPRFERGAGDPEDWYSARRKAQVSPIEVDDYLIDWPADGGFELDLRPSDEIPVRHLQLLDIYRRVLCETKNDESSDLGRLGVMRLERSHLRSGQYVLRITYSHELFSGTAVVNFRRS